MEVVFASLPEQGIFVNWTKTIDKNGKLSFTLYLFGAVGTLFRYLLCEFALGIRCSQRQSQRLRRWASSTL